jgi:sarcosine oxidase
MANTFDVVVLGLGAAGSSALYHLSKSGKRVCGIDQYSPPHNLASSHGQSRITRQAYHENPLYVPFILKAYDLWDELALASGRKLFHRTGGIYLGAADSGVIVGSELSAKTHQIPYDYLTAEEISKRYPFFKTDANTIGILEHNAGILFPEECIRANLEVAERNNASIKLEEKILRIDYDAGIIRIETNKEQYETEKLIVAAGAWTPELMIDLHLPLKVERQVLFWFRDKGSQPSDSKYGNLPVYIWEYETGKTFYGFPDLGDGFKIAHHHAGAQTSPEQLNRIVATEEVKEMESVVKSYLGIDPVFNYATTCMYTNTPDNDFILDYHPANENIIIASPCSGHGFKFASVNGKILSDMALENKQELNISMFSIARFTSSL